MAPEGPGPYLRDNRTNRLHDAHSARHHQDDPQERLAVTAQTATIGVSIVLGLVGDVLLGVAIWRSGILPKWAGALWAFAPVLMYIFGLVYALTIGANATPPTVPAGAVVLAKSGAWMAWSVLSRPSGTQEPVGVATAQPRVR